jgi:hypothetical protein
LLQIGLKSLLEQQQQQQLEQLLDLSQQPCYQLLSGLRLLRVHLKRSKEEDLYGLI